MTGVYTIPDLGPSDLTTTPRENTRRFKVEEQLTSFAEGRQFRAFYNTSIANNQSFVVKVVAPVNGILQNVSMVLHSGDVTLSTRAGGTEGGIFIEDVPTFPKNRQTTALPYTRQFVLSSGGTQTGGIEVDNVRLVVAGATAQRQSVSTNIEERGVQPGVYYWVFTNASNATADVNFSAWWGEYP